MNRFIIPDKQFIQSYVVRYLTEERLLQSVAENNHNFSIYHDIERMGLVARCENKPSDLLVYGLAWKEVI